MQKTIDSERKREKECTRSFLEPVYKKCYHEHFPRNNTAYDAKLFPKMCFYPLSTDVALLQFHYEHTGHAYAISADQQCAYLTSPVADEDV